MRITIAPKLVDHDLSRRSTVSVKEPFSETLCCCDISPALEGNINDFDSLTSLTIGDAKRL